MHESVLRKLIEVLVLYRPGKDEREDRKLYFGDVSSVVTYTSSRWNFRGGPRDSERRVDKSHEKTIYPHQLKRLNFKDHFERKTTWFTNI